MTIAYDPKPSVQQSPVNRHDLPGPRDTNEETELEDKSDEMAIPDAPDEDWMKMYRGRKMEENY